jgi:hypothetical protein
MISLLNHVEFKGKVKKDKDISAIQTFGDKLIIGADEGKKIQILKEITRNQSYKAGLKIKLSDNKGELDIEGIARNENTFYVVGSHSRKRNKVYDSLTHKENLDLLATVEPEPNRNGLFRFTLDPDDIDEEPDIERLDLNELLKNDRHLKLFTKIPGKENGVDIEGIAVDGNHTLYLGFRGPVLRGNFVPVLVTKFDNLSNYHLRFVNLNGQGIRDITKVEKGFLIIGGPVCDGDGSYDLYFWDGSDTIPATDRQVNSVKKLGEIDIPVEGAKAEGITVVEETDSYYKAIIVYDSAKNGSPALFEISKFP